MSFRKMGISLFGIVCLLVSSLVFAAPEQSWSEFIAQVKQEARQQGVRQSIIDEAFAGIKQPNRQVVKYNRIQPEKRITFLKYRNTRASKYRIAMGRKKLKKWEPLLNEVSKRYGVSPCFIVSFWGLETSYGSYMGNFPVVHSLATLAYTSKRKAFFRKQLFLALHVLNGDHVKVKDYKGEWAGASGQPQFLPSSWHNYAVDYNGDGKKDIWKNEGDVFASIANYLIGHGWKSNQPWAVQVSIPSGFNKDLMTRKITKSVSEWRDMGVRIDPNEPMPASNLQASIIEPDGGPVFMVFNNFNVIMKWNRSTYYAGTVGYMAEQICRRKL